MDQSFPQKILSFSEFINLKNKRKQLGLESSEILNKQNLSTEIGYKNSLYESFIESKKVKSDCLNSELFNRKHIKLVEDLKAAHSIIENKLLNQLQLAELTIEEKNKQIDELIKALNQEKEIKEQLQFNCNNYQKINEKLKEINRLLQSKDSSTIIQPIELDKLKKKNDKLNQIIVLKDKEIHEMTKELKDKDTIFNDINKMKKVVDQYDTQMNKMNKEIELRDKIIQELKQSFEGKTISSSIPSPDAKANSIEEKTHNVSQLNDYKQKYEAEVQLNLKMKKSFEELNTLVQSLIESKEKDKLLYAQKINEVVLKENTELKKLNQMYKSKYDIIPQLEKRFEEVFHENNLLKDENKALKLKQVNQQTEAIAKTKEATLLSSIESNNQMIGDTFTLYSIYKSSLLAFSISKREYSQIIPNQFDNFITNYQAKGSITYNTFEGLFIVTGSEYNKLYYYSQKQNTISSIMNFKENHQYGTVFLDNSSKNLIVLSGTKNNLVECLSFEKTELFFLPSLIQRRAKSSCCFINLVLYVFFGFDEQLKQPISTIEYLNMNTLNKTSKWEIMNLKSNDGIIYAFVGHSILNFNDKQVLILGGMNQKNKPNDNLVFIDLNKQVIGELNHQLEQELKKGDCIFSSHSMFRVFLKEEEVCFVNIDDNHNIHIMDSNLKYDFILFSDKALMREN